MKIRREKPGGYPFRRYCMLLQSEAHKHTQDEALSS